MMQLLIEDLSFKTIIGIMKEERTNEQTVIVSAKVAYEHTKGGFLDYMKICREIKKEMQLKKFRLLEEAAVCVCETLKAKNPQIESIELKIVKPEIRSDAKVGIIFEKNFS